MKSTSLGDKDENNTIITRRKSNLIKLSDSIELRKERIVFREQNNSSVEKKRKSELVNNGKVKNLSQVKKCGLTATPSPSKSGSKNLSENMENNEINKKPSTTCLTKIIPSMSSENVIKCSSDEKHEKSEVNQNEKSEKDNSSSEEPPEKREKLDNDNLAAGVNGNSDNSSSKTSNSMSSKSLSSSNKTTTSTSSEPEKLIPPENPNPYMDEECWETKASKVPEKLPTIKDQIIQMQNSEIERNTLGPLSIDIVDDEFEDENLPTIKNVKSECAKCGIRVESKQEERTHRYLHGMKQSLLSNRSASSIEITPQAVPDDSNNYEDDRRSSGDSENGEVKNGNNESVKEKPSGHSSRRVSNRLFNRSRDNHYQNLTWTANDNSRKPKKRSYESVKSNLSTRKSKRKKHLRYKCASCARQFLTEQSFDEHMRKKCNKSSVSRAKILLRKAAKHKNTNDRTLRIRKAPVEKNNNNKTTNTHKVMNKIPIIDNNNDNSKPKCPPITNVNPFACPLCNQDYGFNSGIQLGIHKTVNCPGVQTNVKKISDKIGCSICGTVLKSDKELRNHKLTKHANFRIPRRK